MARDGAVLPVGEVTLDPVRDAATLAFTGVVTVLTGLLFGLAPAAAASRVDVNAMLKAGEAGPGSGVWRRHAGKSLVVAQVAISVTLLVATGLLVHSLQRLYRVETGLDANRVLFAGVYPALLRYDHARELELYRSMAAALEDAPGIETVSFARYDLGRGRLNFIAPHLFATLGVPLVRGRDLTWADVAAGAGRAVVSETAARQFYPGEDFIGRLVPARVAQGLDRPLQIVGVVPDIRTTYRRGESRPAVYLPYTLAPPDRLGQVDLFVRSSGSPETAAAAVRQTVRRIEPDLALLNLRVLSSEFDRSVGDHRATAALLGACGLLAVMLVSIGLYGTMSQAVARRTKELGIRISLGAARPAMLAMILRESVSMVAAGFAIGIPVALVAARGLSGLLFGIGAADPVALAGTVLVMSSVALVAGYVPARRASRIDPIIALRHE